MGPNSHQDLCNLWAKVHRTFVTEGRRNRSGKISFPILDILSGSGDIRNQSRTLPKIDRNFACFWPPIFFREATPKFLEFFASFEPDSDPVAKFRGDRPRDLEDVAA